MSVQGPRIDGWWLGRDDRHCAGDFDGDGLEEIYVRSAGWAGVLKWSGDRFGVVWMREGSIQHRLATGEPRALALTDRDSSYAGRFLPAADGIVHRGPSGVALLTWESGAIKTRLTMPSPLGWAGNRWPLTEQDRFTVGDFHRTGLEFAEPMPINIIDDSFSDVFIHSGTGTAMLGFNNPAPMPGISLPGHDHSALTWNGGRELLFRLPQPQGPVEIPDERAFLEQGIIIGNLADGGYIIIRPGGQSEPVPPWDPAVLKAIAEAATAIRDEVRVLEHEGYTVDAGAGWAIEPRPDLAGEALKPEAQAKAEERLAAISGHLKVLRGAGVEVTLVPDLH